MYVYVLCLPVSGAECKKRWKSVRDHYRKDKKDERSSTGSAAKKYRAGYWEWLRFLDAEEDEKYRFTNISVKEEPEILITEADIAAEGDSSTEQTFDQTTRTSFHQIIEQPGFQPSSMKRLECDSFNKYLKDKREEKCLKRCLEHFLEPREENEIDLFCKTMGATLKKFRPELAIRTKAKIFEIVSEMELLNHQSLPSNSGSKI